MKSKKILLVLAALSMFVLPQRSVAAGPQIDPRTVGVWEFTDPDPVSSETVQISVAADGTSTKRVVKFSGPHTGPMPAEKRAVMETVDGHWRSTTETGHKEDLMYEFAGPDTIKLHPGGDEVIVLTRVKPAPVVP